MSLGERIKQVREEKGITQHQLSEASGVCQQMISKLETGRANATADIVSLAAALDVSPMWLQGLSKQRDDSAKSDKNKTNKKANGKGEALNHKAVQASIEFLTQNAQSLFERSGFRRQADLFIKCYELCTHPKNKSMSRVQLVALLGRRAKRFG